MYQIITNLTKLANVIICKSTGKDNSVEPKKESWIKRRDWLPSNNHWITLAGSLATYLTYLARATFTIYMVTTHKYLGFLAACYVHLHP